MTNLNARRTALSFRLTRTPTAAAALLATLAGCQSGDTEPAVSDEASLVEAVVDVMDFAGACDDPLLSDDGRTMLVHVCGHLDSGSGTFEHVDLLTMRRTRVAAYRGTGRSWSAGGGWFAFSTHGDFGIELHMVRFDGTGHRTFLPENAPELARTPKEVSLALISRDGSRVAFKIEGPGAYRYGIFVASLATPAALRAPTQFVPGFGFEWTSGDTFFARSTVNQGFFFAKVDPAGNVVAGASRVPSPLAYGSPSGVDYPDLSGETTIRGPIGYAVEHPTLTSDEPSNILRYDVHTGAATVVDTARLVRWGTFVRTPTGIVYVRHTQDGAEEVRRADEGQATTTLLRVAPPDIPEGHSHVHAMGLDLHYASDDGRTLLLSKPHASLEVDGPAVDSLLNKVFLIAPNGRDRTFVDAYVDSVDGTRAYLNTTPGSNLPDMQIDLTTGVVSPYAVPGNDLLWFVPSAAGGGHGFERCEMPATAPPSPLDGMVPLRLVRYDAAGAATADACRLTKGGAQSAVLGSTGAIITSQHWKGRHRFSNPRSFWFRVYRP
jgi:hypothetical protein